MHYWQSIILGIVEGITEYLPVSSTGHLIVTQRLMGIGNGEDKVAADAFAICIQGGAIAAVMGLYFSRVWKMCLGLMGKNPEGLKLLINLIVAFIPAAVTALALKSVIKAHLFGLKPIIIAWFIGGLAILYFSRKFKNAAINNNTKSLVELDVKGSFIIGCLQCVAIWPGTSRSLMTICGGYLAGLKTKDAVEFSFLLGVMTLSAAAILDAKDHGALIIQTYGIAQIALGFIAATVAAALAVKWLVAFLQKHGMAPFGYYRIIVAVVTALLLWRGVIHDQAPAKITSAASSQRG